MTTTPERDVASSSALAHVRARSRVGTLPGEPQLTINLHPDRIARDGRTVLEALLADGVVRTQFETGISAGGLDHVVDGARSGWERTMFGGAYDGVATVERPRYAGLTLVGDPYGACPRFGSCHLVLGSHLLERSTFTWGDSATEPSAYGVWDSLGDVAEAALQDGWCELAGRPRPADQLLDTYVEAQVHARVRLGEDVETIVLDESFWDSPFHALAGELSDRYEVALAWAPARVVDPARLDPTFRTPRSPRLAIDAHTRMARPDQQLDAELVGRAAQEVVRARGRGWETYGEEVEVLQELKYLWHHLVAFGTWEPGVR